MRNESETEGRGRIYGKKMKIKKEKEVARRS
jgi:hypothetical protein